MILELRSFSSFPILVRVTSLTTLTPTKRGVAIRKLVILMLTIILVMVVENRGTKRLNAQIKRRSQARRKRKQNKKEPTLLGTKMMSLHQVKMKK